MYYRKEKRAQIDNCNICGEVIDLTWDHIPPKFCDNASAKECIHLLDVNAGQDFSKTISQNGIKYRSICKNCNNNLLGSRYDPEYKQIHDEISDWLKRCRIFVNETHLVNFQAIPSGIIVPYDHKLNIAVNRLSRSIVGHILAAKNFYDNQTLTDINLRKYFLDENALPPHGMHLYFYIYPYTTIVISRDFSAIGNGNYRPPKGSCSCLCAFPLAFILVDASSNIEYPCCDLFKYCTRDINEIKTLAIDIRSACYPRTDKLRDPLWPLNINDNEDGVMGVIIGDSARSTVVSRNR
jgi:hypothetical protein